MPDVKKEVESLLFSSGRAMLEKDLADIIGAKPKDIQKAIEQLKKDYETRDTSLALMQTQDGWKLNVKEQYVSLVTKIVADTELPFPILETLSVIAYKAPAWQAEVIKTRGTNAYEHIQTLIDAGFVDRRKKGRSFELVLTQKFFDYFDVPGEQKLKMMFKDVKPGEPNPKRKVGKLQVVDVPQGDVTQPEQAQIPGEIKTLAEVKDGKLGELEVVPIKPGKKVEQFKPDNEFLDSIDSKIGELSKKNDELDQDDMFKKEEAPAEGEDDEFTPPENKKTKEIFGEATSEDKEESDEEDTDKDSDKDAEEEEQEEPKDPLKDDDKLEI